HAPSRYELKIREHHHHIVCIKCGKIIEFQNEIIEKQIHKISKDHNFSMEHHIFELYGRCNKSSCQ
ncbi:MAG: transcriptional repressor, partial [Bdellovibrionales bacterium]|nr:transcriptional repressor [Bdellovibrionales bacterium]